MRRNFVIVRKGWGNATTLPPPKNRNPKRCWVFLKYVLQKSSLFLIITLIWASVHTFEYKYMWLLPQKCVLAPRISFFFVWKNLLLYVVMLEKVADRGFLTFWPFENKRKSWKRVKYMQKIWNSAKGEYYPPRHHRAEPFYSSCIACH